LKKHKIQGKVFDLKVEVPGGAFSLVSTQNGTNPLLPDHHAKKIKWRRGRIEEMGGKRCLPFRAMRRRVIQRSWFIATLYWWVHPAALHAWGSWIETSMPPGNIGGLVELKTRPPELTWANVVAISGARSVEGEAEADTNRPIEKV